MRWVAVRWYGSSRTKPLDTPSLMQVLQHFFSPTWSAPATQAPLLLNWQLVISQWYNLWREPSIHSTPQVCDLLAVKSSKVLDNQNIFTLHPARETPPMLLESQSSYVPSPTSSFHPRETCSPIASPTKPEHSELGSALGPDWHTELRMKGSGFSEVCKYG